MSESNGLARNRVAEIAARVKAATPGPWHWGGNVDVHHVYLSTVANDRVMVMTFDRWGMYAATPTFWRRAADVPSVWDGRPVKAGECAVRQVPYQGDLVRLEHPDAELIANAPADLEYLLAAVEHLRGLAAAAVLACRAALDSQDDE